MKRVGRLLVLCCLFGISRSAAPSPAPSAKYTEKVVKLLDELIKEVQEDAQADDKSHQAYSAWYTKERGDASKVLVESKGSATRLTTALQEEESLRAQLQEDLDEVAGKLPGLESDLQDATGTRKKERDAYEEQSTKLEENIDGLRRSLVVLDKEGVVSTAPPTVDVDEDDYSEYNSQTGGVTKLLENVLTKSQDQLKQLTANEQAAAKVFKQMKESLEKQIAASKQRMSDIKSQVAKSQERSSRKSNDLREAQQLVETTTATLKQLDEQNAERNKDYKDRSQKRDDELTALQEAQEILTSTAAQTLLSLGSHTQRDESTDAADSAAEDSSDGKDESPLSFLMLKASQKRSLREASQVRGASDPFHKPKKLMQDMLERLTNEQAKDQRQKAFCDLEMQRTAESLHDKKKAVKKLTDEVEALDAEIATLEAEIPELAQELSDLLGALGNATELRAEEKGNAQKAIKEYKDAQVPLQGAIKVLQEFYAKSGMDLQQLRADPTPEEASYKSKVGAVAGVIGILEVALEDMIDLQKDCEAQEANAQKLYQEFKNDSDVRVAVLKKDLEYKNRMKVKLESTRAQTSSDLKNYQKELDAVESYMEQLTGSCTIKGDSYEARKAKREKEIQGLQEALGHLRGA
mmetsp:Transcript_14815/g.33705  ORF Transcript_14815/g.33705 Transcript_14815/m.33705 type:complete len:636 (+) Transcript_14815:91-1998(+)